ncbi:MAG: NAD-dependent epimerase/dehydratase family protein [Chloroflexi bacterium]|nr:NAD-dependent epimerase/dehydratase family protein [Chloroflexota bacterium]
MKVLVLGGTRFVGLHLVYELLRRGHDVSILNRGKTRGGLPPEVKRFYADRKDPQAVRVALEGQEFDAVFDISAYVEEDLGVMLELFGGMVAHYVFCSTTFVYATSDFAPIREDFPLNLGPDASPYATGKLRCEELLFSAFKERGFPVSIIRPSMVYGPHNYHLDREFSYFARFLRQRKILVPGEGLTLLHFGHVDDLACYFASILGNRQVVGQAYTVTGPEAITIRGYISAIAKIVGVKPDILFLEPRVVDSLKRPIFPYAWQRSAVYSIEKAKSQLGVVPRYDFVSGHKHTFEWYLENGLDLMDWDFSYEDEVIKNSC